MISFKLKSDTTTHMVKDHLNNEKRACYFKRKVNLHAHHTLYKDKMLCQQTMREQHTHAHTNNFY